MNLIMDADLLQTNLLKENIHENFLEELEICITLKKTKELKQYQESISKTIAVWEEIFYSNDIDELLLAEKMALELEKKHYHDNELAQKFLSTTLEDFKDMQYCLNLLREEEYRAIATTYNHKERKKIDSKNIFYKAINKHIESFDKRIIILSASFEIYAEEIEIIKQRQKNMELAKKIYTDLQNKILGLKLVTS